MDLSHVAVFVDRLDDSILGPALSDWGETRVITGQPVVVDGRAAEFSGRTRRIRTAVASAFGVSVEEGGPGAPISPEPDGAWHHVAVWCPDLGGTARAFEEHGYRKDVVGRDADGRIATFAYMVSDRGPRFELMDAAMRTGWTRAFLADAQADGAGDGSRGFHGAPLVPDHVSAVVADDADLDALMMCWQRTIGLEWGAVEEASTVVATPAGERELRTRSVRSVGSTPYVSVIAPEPGSFDVLTPLAHNGWHHVGFRSRALRGDVAALEEAGFAREFWDRAPGGPARFALLRSPEGVRIDLAAA
jgi:hypothetical protein